MKQIKLIKISLACLALAVTCGVAQAQTTNLLGNPGFEMTSGKYINFDPATPFWNDDGVNYTNTGVENAGAHSGNNRAFEMVGDDGAYQISTNPVPLQAGQQIILTWWALGTTSSDPLGTNPTDPMQIVGIITATNYNSYNLGGGNDLFTDTTAVLVVSNGLGNAWAQYSLTYTVQAADAGKYPGVFFFAGEVTNTPATNVWAGYDDFALWVVPAGSKPIILTEPVSQTAPIGNTVSFTVSALEATGYRWQAGAPASGVYTNLSNDGQFSGVTTTTLTISNVTTNNNLDIVVVVSNGSGSVTSAPPANLTVAGLIYSESFNMPTTGDQSVNHVGWMNDKTGAANRIFSNNHGVTYPRCAVYAYNSTGVTEAYYGTTTTITGGPYPASPYPVTNRMAFPGVNLGVAQNVSFTVAMNTPSASTSQSGFICVQMNYGPWYVSTNAMQALGGLAFVTNSTRFYPAMSAWKQLTVSGTGSDSGNLVPVIGPVATNDLTGYITGVGLVVTFIGGNTLQFDNYTVLGAIPPIRPPVFSGLPQPATNYTGTTQTFAALATSNGVASAVTYQWISRPALGGTFVNLTNGGQYSGVLSTTLVISNITSANHREYAVIATDGAGSVESDLAVGAVPAILTITDSAPLLVNGTTAIYPNNGNLFISTLSVTNEAGNNNTLNFTASFTGTQPISYQWLVSPNPDGTGAVIIPGATSPTYTLSNPQVSDTGYYTLQASNRVSGVNLTNSAWIQLVILPASSATIQWSAPVAINPTLSTALTAAQILGLPGAYFEAESFGAGSIKTATNGATVFTFDNTSANAGLTSTTRAITGAYTGPSTGASPGDTNFDSILGTDEEVYSPSTLTLNYLTSGQFYTVQLFGLNDTAGASRQGNYSIPTDPADVSASFSFGDNVYVVGTFQATGASQAISLGMAGGGAYVAAVIVRNIVPSPTITWSGSNLLVTWPGGTTLLQTTNIITGPWITNHSTSPLTVVPTAPTMFYRTRIP
jgi:hypothetical protein